MQMHRGYYLLRLKKSAVILAHEASEVLGVPMTSIGVPSLGTPIIVGTALLEVVDGGILAVLALLPAGKGKVNAGSLGLGSGLLCHFWHPFYFAISTLLTYSFATIIP